MNLAIVGASGLVGRTVLKVLEERGISPDKLLLLGKSSVGEKLQFMGVEVEIQRADPNVFDGVDYAIFSAGKSAALQLAPEAVKRGCIVIDNSSAFRFHDSVPLVVPEVNPHRAFEHQGIIANPNCATIQLVVVLNPLLKLDPLKVVVTSLQSVTGAGQRAVQQLRLELNGEPCEVILPHNIAYNLIPQIDSFLDDGYTFEEFKIINESKKILECEIHVTATCVRTPTIGAHCQSVYIEFPNPVDTQTILELLSSSDGIEVVDNPASQDYAMPINVNGKDSVFVSRIRHGFDTKSINLWIAADNLRKGAATNAVQILQLLLNSK